MTDASKPRTVRLTDYLIKQGAGADAATQAAIFVKIHTGELPTVVVVHPDLPPGANIRDIVRYSNTEAHEVSVLDIPKVKAEIMKGALGRPLDWSLLEAIAVQLPVAPDETKPDEPAAKKMSPTNERRVKKILQAIVDLDLDPHALAKPARRKRGGDRERIWAKIPPHSMKHKDFENAWSYALDMGYVGYQYSDSERVDPVCTN